MQVVVTFAVLILCDHVASESLKIGAEKSTNNIDIEPPSSKASSAEAMLNARKPLRDPSQSDRVLWSYNPISQTIDSSGEEHLPRLKDFKQPQPITRISKTASLGFSPVFYKGYFEPFERRLRPVTLVGMRKNGKFPRQITSSVKSESSDVAELQSPYNDISIFWIDDKN